LTIEGREIEFSDGFTELHTNSYSEILKGNGFGLKEARASIELAHGFRVKN
jgi:UDP-N-acetyl-2-amino-2-deoxyglucuronate dehydrogenase